MRCVCSKKQENWDLDFCPVNTEENSLVTQEIMILQRLRGHSNLKQRTVGLLRLRGDILN